MFTLIRPLAALLLGVFALFAAQAYEPLFDPQANLGRFPLWAAGVAAVTGWMFLGGRMGRALWFSAFVGVQAVVLSAVFTAMLLAVREVFVLGYRRIYREPMEAFVGYFEIITNWLGKALVTEYLVFLGVGGVVVGVCLHLVHGVMERRRNAR